MEIKICGITNLADAQAAVAAGADMLGFNFYRPSPRYIEPRNAREIIEKLRAAIHPIVATMVGVFVNEPSAESIVKLVQQVGLDAVQLHGDETPEFCQRLRSLLNGRKVIKVFRVDTDFSSERIDPFPVDAVMLDAFHPHLHGGTGQQIDWVLARRARRNGRKLFLAGGLSPENVVEAIRQVEPDAVDACSSLESSSGLKDIQRMTAFVRAVRNG